MAIQNNASSVLRRLWRLENSKVKAWMASTSAAMTLKRGKVNLVMTGLADDKRGHDVEQRRNLLFVMTGLVPVIHASMNLAVMALVKLERFSIE